jgi:cyclopropane fatty-acyl-phospholipid synthase-like methyltransferase
VRNEEPAEFYDDLHGRIDRSETKHHYSRLFNEICRALRAHGSRSVLEVGCGSGILACMIIEHGLSYRGFDFSRNAVANASRHSGRPEFFSVGNALDSSMYCAEYDTVVCTEVLEHVDRDLEVIEKWKSGAWCICSVPNFDYEGHVRFFRTANDVSGRYGDLIEIAHVNRVTRPFFPHGGVEAYLQQVRWSRKNPKRLLGLLGIRRFEHLGGWFVFAGRRT